MQKTLQLILPAHNESGNILAIYEEICAALASTEYAFEIIFINDGSTDDTLDKIKQLGSEDIRVKYIHLSRNFGHQNAIKAGVDYCTAEVVIMMDCDLQHPPDLINTMLGYYEQGYDVVRTKRQESKDEGFFKRKFSNLFYVLLNKISEIHLDKGSADFRLVSGKALDQLRAFNEYDLFYRGLIKWMGFHQISIDYTPNVRRSGLD